MRHAASGRRSRNRSNNRRGGNNNRSHVFDSNGPEVRIRGTAHQICEKYQNLAKDASSSGDYVLTESYYQYAEHYQRIINGWQDTVEDVMNGVYKPETQDQEIEISSSNRDDSSPRENKNNDDLGLPSSITGNAKEKETEDA